jgi:PAS domain S-box-containing protein
MGQPTIERAPPVGARVILRGEVEFARLLDKIPAGAYTCDPDGLITYFNRHAVELWGRAPQLNDPIDRFCGSFRLFAPDGSPIAHDRCWMALALRDEREYNGEEIVIERPDGSRVTALAHANPIRDDLGRVVGSVNVLVDITDRKRTEDLLREADRSKNAFLAILGHELRSPLAPIRSAVEVLKLQRTGAPELQTVLGVIDRQIGQMTRLVDDLVDVARITCNRLELRRETVELASVLRAALETSRPLVAAREHELLVSIPAEPIEIEADPARLAQAISNLLGNAAKYTERGGRIWLEAVRRGDEAVIAVRDTGIGIAAAMLPRIFAMFAQADASPRGAQGGLGVGLSLVEQIVTLHGGRVEARSAGPGQGSEFTVRLPARPGAPRARQRGRRGDTRAEGNRSPLRVLVVDDNPDAADSLGMLLQAMGHDSRVAYDGPEAIETAEQFHPDAVLLDIGLPTLGGHEVAGRLRERPWARGVLLVAVTGWGQDEDRVASEAAGFDHHLVKPVDAARLRQILAARGPRA